MSEKKKAYLICPVRNCTPEQRKEMDRYVEILEQHGNYEFHYPPRDVDQKNDDGGIRICESHRAALFHCDEVHVWWDDESFGCHFDLGMAYMLTNVRHRAYTSPGARSKPPMKFAIANPDEVKYVSHKSFQNVLVNLLEISDASNNRQPHEG